MPPYFLTRTGEHDVILTSFTADVAKPSKIPFVRMCEIDEGRGMQSLVAISPFDFSGQGGGERGGLSPPLRSRGAFSIRTIKHYNLKIKIKLNEIK